MCVWLAWAATITPATADVIVAAQASHTHPTFIPTK